MKFSLGYAGWLVMAGLRFLGVVGIAGLFGRAFNVFSIPIWLSLLFIVIGFFMAKVISDAEKELLNTPRFRNHPKNQNKA